MEVPRIDTADIEARGCRWLRTADGRIVEYSVAGSQRPDARVLVSGYFAGMPVPDSWKQAYEELNLKVIDISYPGLGLSTRQPGRKVSEWPETDVEPVLAAEGVQDFTVHGASFGTIHAMAVAQHYGPGRVNAMGLRVPYFGLPLSTELGLPAGQPRFPTTDELLRNTLKVRAYRFIFGLVGGFTEVLVDPGNSTTALMKRGVLGGLAKNMADYAAEYPAEFETARFATQGIFGSGSETVLYMMARDVALDLPGLDPRKIELSGDRVVIWYAADDTDCPPSHGEWLAKHFRAKTRVFEGYGHIGGAFTDQPQFLEELMGRP